MRKFWSVTTLFALLAITFAPAAEAVVLHRRRVADGVRLTVVRRRHPLQRIRIVSVKMSAPSKIRPVLATGQLPGLARTSTMARARGALVAINGDYARPSGRPVMAFAQNGRLAQTPLAWGRNFAVADNESTAYIGHPNVRVRVIAPFDSLRVGRINNGRPSARGVALFTRTGGNLERPPKRSCSARLHTSGFPRISSVGPGLEIPYRVEKVRCSDRRLMLRGGVVLSARRSGPGAKSVRALVADTELSLHWSLGWERVRETVGGNPTLVEDGKVVVPSSTHPFYRRNPRTGVGTTADGRVLMVTVDGRRRHYSRGITLRGFARLFKSLGANWALNLDGGGSTTMVVRGSVINRPSDGPERPVSSALLVVPGWAGAQTASLETSSGDVAGATVWDEIVADPASTGGLTSSLERRGAGLPRALLEAARTFERLRH